MNDKRGTWPRWSSATAYDLVHIMLRVMNIEFSGRGDQSWVFDHGFQLARLVVDAKNQIAPAMIGQRCDMTRELFLGVAAE